jgi:hypothetical protein
VTTTLGNKLDELGRIRDRTRVGHRMDRCESPGGRGPGSRQDCLRTFATGFPQVGMQVNESWKGDQALCLDYAVSGVRHRTNLTNDAVYDENVRCICAHDRCTADQDGHRESPISV